MLMNLCLEYLKGSKERIDIFYARYHFFDRHYIKLLKSAKEKNAKVIVEAHSSPKFEKSLSIMTPVYINDSIWNRYGKRYIDVVAAMCNDEYLWGIKTIQFANAIDINTVKLHQPNIIRHHQKEIHLIAVAFEGRVHGLSLIHISEPTRLGMISYA